MLSYLYYILEIIFPKIIKLHIRNIPTSFCVQATEAPKYESSVTPEVLQHSKNISFIEDIRRSLFRNHLDNYNTLHTI